MKAITLSFSVGKNITFIGEIPFSELFTYVDKSRNLFYHDEDEEGNKCEPYTTDEMGTIVSTDDCNSETGEIEFGPYDRYYTIKVSSKDDLSTQEIEAIRKFIYMSPELTAIIREPKENVTTLEGFAQFLNDSDEYPVFEADEIIERNGWEACEDDSEVCRFGGKRLEMNERGKFEVVDYED